MFTRKRHRLHILVFVLLCYLAKDLFSTFSTQSREELKNYECMPIDLEIDTYENLVKNVDKHQHPECNEEDWIIIQKDGTVLYNREYLTKKNITIKSNNFIFGKRIRTFRIDKI